MERESSSSDSSSSTLSAKLSGSLLAVLISKDIPISVIIFLSIIQCISEICIKPSDSVGLLLQQVVNPVAAAEVSLDPLMVLLSVKQHILQEFLEIALLLADHVG
jgi:hypothetical protein